MAVGAPPLMAQVPVAGVSFGVDTTAADVGDIVRLLRAYLARPQTTWADTAARAAGLWSTASALDRHAGDLTRGLVYQGFPATVLGVTSEGPGDSVYHVKVLYARADTSGRRINPLALQRLYAVRAPGAPHGWQLTGALPRLTRNWERRTVAPLTFWYAPGQRPDSARAARAARFVDSVAALLAVRPPERLDYYVTASPDEYYRALGLDYFPLPSGRGTAGGGQAIVDERIVLSGDPAQGEAYLHELAHAVLGPRYTENWIVSEGLATWLGGSKGRGAAELYRVLHAYQRTHPGVTLANLIDGEVASGWGTAETDALYATAALFIETVHAREGLAGLRALASTVGGTDATLALLRARLPEHAGDLDRWWRRAAATAASTP
jgi:hypothetical protein